MAGVRRNTTRPAARTGDTVAIWEMRITVRRVTVDRVTVGLERVGYDRVR